NEEDIKDIYNVDSDAFEDIWQFPRAALVKAIQQSAYTSVAITDNRITGYQISSITEATAHVMRLAVSRDYQSRGIGRMLLSDTVAKMSEWHGIGQFTLNTQASNNGSQLLYRSFGFKTIQPQIKVLHKSLAVDDQPAKHVKAP
ncbi:MAG TPA: GNAT family N-acetyltransferase, partial [Anaerolineae bacterium]